MKLHLGFMLLYLSTINFCVSTVWQGQLIEEKALSNSDLKMQGCGMSKKNVELQQCSVHKSTLQTKISQCRINCGDDTVHTFIGWTEADNYTKTSTPCRCLHSKLAMMCENLNILEHLQNVNRTRTCRIAKWAQCMLQSTHAQSWKSTMKVHISSQTSLLTGGMLALCALSLNYC